MKQLISLTAENLSLCWMQSRSRNNIVIGTKTKTYHVKAQCI